MKLIERGQACLLLIDVQEKLLPAIEMANDIEQRCAWMLRLANELEIPVIVSEQYPKGLGPTCSTLLQSIQTATRFEKTHFSCANEEDLQFILKARHCRQVVIMGIETHVCVLQSAIELLEQGYQVFVVADAVGSRKAYDKKMALKRLKQAGASLVTTEMFLFECLRTSAHEEFKRISQIFLKN